MPRAGGGDVKRDDGETLFFPHRRSRHRAHRTPSMSSGAPVVPPTPGSAAHPAPDRRGQRQPALRCCAIPGNPVGEHSVLATTPLHHVWQARLVPDNKPHPGAVTACMLGRAAGFHSAANTFGCRCQDRAVDVVRRPVREPDLVLDRPACWSRWSPTVNWSPSRVARPVRVRHSAGPGTPADASIRTPAGDELADADHGRYRAGPIWGWMAGVAELMAERGVEGQPRSFVDHHLTARSRMACSRGSRMSLRWSPRSMPRSTSHARADDGANPELLMPAAVESITVTAEFADDTT